MAPWTGEALVTVGRRAAAVGAGEHRGGPVGWPGREDDGPAGSPIGWPESTTEEPVERVDVAPSESCEQQRPRGRGSAA